MCVRSLTLLSNFVLLIRETDRADTQPTQSRMEPLPDPDGKRSVLGGTKVGNGAWAVAWVDTIMEVKPGELEGLEVEEKKRMLKEAEASAVVVDPT